MNELPQPSGERPVRKAGGRVDPRKGMAAPSQPRTHRPRGKGVPKVGCITCFVYGHPSNMVNIYDGEYQCQECRWGL